MQPVNYKTYFGKMVDPQQAKPTESFMVFAPSDKTKEVVQNALKQIIANDQEAQVHHSSPLSVTIGNITEDEITYKIFKKDDPIPEAFVVITIAELEGPLPEIKLHAVRQQAPPTQISFRDIWKRFMAFESAPQSEILAMPYKLITGFFKLIVSPFVAIQRYLAAIDITKKQAALYLKVCGENNYSSFLTALEEGVTLTKNDDQSSDAEKELHRHMTECLETGRKIEAALDQPLKLAQLSTEQADKLIAKFNENTAEERILGEIPTGYYREGVYYPMMLTFYCKDSTLCMEKLTTDPQATENTSPEKLVYGFSKPEKLGDVLKQIFIYNRPPTLVDKKTATAQAKQMAGIAEFKPSTTAEETSFKVEDPAVIFENMLVSHDVERVGQPIVAPARKPTAPSKTDPWVLIRHWIRSEFPTTPLADKISLTLTVSLHHMQTLFANFNRLSPEQQQEVLPLLEKEVNKLHRVFDKVFGEEEAFATMLNAPQLTEIKQCINRLNEELNELARVRGTAAVHMWRQDLNSTATTAITLPLTPVMKAETSNVEPPQRAVIYENRIHFERLQKAISGGEIVEAKDEYDYLRMLINDLMNVGDYSQAAGMSVKLLNLLPAPASNLNTPNFWNHEALQNSVELHWWGESVSDVTKCLWESQLRLGAAHVWPEQRLALLNARAIHSKLISIQEELAIRKLKAAFEELLKDNSKFPNELWEKIKPGNRYSPDATLEMYLKFFELREGGKSHQGQICKLLGLSWEETASLYSNAVGDSEQATSWIDKNPYLISIDPESELKLKKLRDFFREAPNTQILKTLPNVRLDTLENGSQYRCDIANLRKGYLGLPPGGDDIFNTFVKDAYECIAFPKEGEETPLPHLVIAMRRNLIMSQCLMHPEASLYVRFPNTTLGNIEGARWFEQLNRQIEGVDKELKPAMLRNLQQLDLIKRLNKMGRLEFATSAYIADGRSQIIIVSQDPVEDGDAQKGMVYRPQGLGVGKAFLDMPSDMRDLHNDQSASGTVPTEFILHHLAKEGAGGELSNQLTDIPRLNDFRSEIDSLVSSIQSPTPETERYAPLDRVALSNLHIKNDITVFGERFTGPLASTALEALEKILQKSELLEDEQVQRVFAIALFKPFGLAELITGNPQFVLERLGEIRHIIQEAFKSGHYKTAAFLMFIGDRIARQANLVNRQDIVDACPNYDTLYQVGAQPTSGMELLRFALAEKDSPKKFLHIFILDWFHLHPDIPISADELAAMLHSHYILQSDASEVALPLLQNTLGNWMENEWIPQLLDSVKDDHIKRNAILNELHKLIKGAGALDEWEPSPNNPFLFKSSSGIELDIKAGALRTPQLAGQQGLPLLQGNISLLPKDILTHPEYVQLFGDTQIHAYCTPGASLQDFTYQFETEDKNRFRIEFNHDTQTAVVYQWLDNKTAGPEYVGWYEHEQVKAQDLTNAAKMVKQYGIWRSEEHDKAFLIINRMDKWKLSDLLSVSVDARRNVRGLHTVATQDKPSLEVCQDTNGTYSRWLGFTSSDNVLFLKSKESKSPTEIRILDKNIVLKKQPDGNWLCTEGIYKGYRWERDYDKLSKRANDVRNALGNAFESIILTLVKGNEEKLVIWPYRVESARHSVLTLQKDLSALERAQLPQLELMITETASGHLEKANGATFLYISYLLQARGDYKQAFFYLDKARRQGIGSAAERITFQRVVNGIQQLTPPKTLRAMAFKLKAELVIAKLQNKLVYDPADPQQFISERERILALFNKYTEKRLDALQHRHIPVLEKELILSDLELQELEVMRSEALLSIMHDMLGIPLPDTKEVTEPTKLEISRPPSGLKQAPPQFLVHLMTFMADPSKPPKEQLLTLSYLDQNNILKNFWTYWKQIKNDKLKPEQLTALFAAHTRVDPKAHDAANVIQSCELAKRLLIECAELNLADTRDRIESDYRFETQLELVLKVDPTQLYRMKQSLPTEPYSKYGFLNLIRIHRAGHNVPPVFTAFEKPIKALLALFKEEKPIPHYREITAPVADVEAEEKEKEEEFEDLGEKKEQAAVIPAPTAEEGQAETNKATILKFLESIDQYPDRFSAEEVSAIKAAANRMSESEQQQKKTVPELGVLLASYGANLPEMRRLVATTKRIEQREQRIREAAQHPVQRIYNNEILDLDHLEARQAGISNRFASSDRMRDEYVTPVENASKFLPKYLWSWKVPMTDKMLAEERDLQHLGFEKTKKTMLAQAQNTRVLIPNAGFEVSVRARQEELQTKITTGRETILQWAKENASPAVKLQLAAKVPFGEAAVVEKILDLYQQGLLGDDTISKTITTFLFNATELQQINKAMELYPKLQRSRDRGEQINISMEMFKLLKGGTDYERYLAFDLVEGQKVFRNELLDPSLSRKMLVSEYRQGIIFSDEQRTMISQIRDNPNVIALLRMGKGKSSVIMPTVIQVLTEMNMLVFMLITEELWLHRESMDRTTRDWFDQAASQFDFDINMPLTPAFLASMYDDLLRVKEERGYCVTTIERRAAVENKLTSVANEISTLVESAKPDAITRIVNLRMQEMWLRRIKNLLDGDEERLGFRTQYFQDEGDEISDVRREINQQLINPSKPNGGMRAPDQTVVNVTKTLFNVILGGSIKELDELQEAILHDGRYASLNIKTIRSHIATIADAILDDGWLAKLGLTGIEPDRQRWIDYLTGKDKSIPLGIPLTEEQSKVVSAIKHILSTGGTLESVLQKGLNVDLGVREADEVVVVPRENELEKTNTQFGDEYELVVSHYLQYAAAGPGTEFCMHVINKMRTKDPEIYQSIREAVNKEFPDLRKDFQTRLREFIQSPQGWEYRLAILERYVLSAGYINLAEEQITLNVHALLHGLNCGMASGTAELENLPEPFSRELCTRESLREAEAETFLRISMGSKNGLDEPVTVVPDDQLFSKLKEAIHDDHLKSVIALTSIANMPVAQLIEQLRSEAPTRQFIYVDFQSGQPVRMMWNPKEEHAIPYNRDLIDEKKCFFLYPPAATRGIHFDVPSSVDYWNIIIPGPTTTLNKVAQAAWRLRNLGPMQRLRFWSLESVAQRINKSQGVPIEKVTVGHVKIDIIQQNLDQQSMRVYKAAMQRADAIAVSGVRKMAFADNADAHRTEYWSEDNQYMIQEDLEADAFLFKICRGFMIQSKDIDFKADLQPTTMVDTLKKINESYDTTKARLNAIKEAIVTAKLFALENGRTWMRYEDAQQRVDTMINKLEYSQLEYNSNFDRVHGKYVPKKVASTTSGSQNAMSYVQQQQQQQQLQQQTVAKLKGKEPAKKDWHKPYFKELLNGTEKLETIGVTPSRLYPLETTFDLPNCGLEGLHMYVSETVKDVNEIITLQGEPLFRLLIVGKPDHPIICWIGTFDYHQALKGDLRLRDAYAAKMKGAGLYTISESVSQLQYVDSDDKTGEPDLSRPETIKLCAISRFLMGFSNFSKEERVQFGNWVSGLDDKQRKNLQNSLKRRGWNKQLDILTPFL